MIYTSGAAPVQYDSASTMPKNMSLLASDPSDRRPTGLAHSNKSRVGGNRVPLASVKSCLSNAPGQEHETISLHDPGGEWDCRARGRWAISSLSS